MVVVLVKEGETERLMPGKGRTKRTIRLNTSPNSQTKTETTEGLFQVLEILSVTDIFKRFIFILNINRSLPKHKPMKRNNESPRIPAVQHLLYWRDPGEILTAEYFQSIPSPIIFSIVAGIIFCNFPLYFWQIAINFQRWSALVQRIHCLKYFGIGNFADMLVFLEIVQFIIRLST